MDTSVLAVTGANPAFVDQVITFLLKYANPVVGVAATFIFEWLKRNVLEKIVALTSTVKFYVYPAMVIFMSIGIGAVMQALRPWALKWLDVPLVNTYLPAIANIWITGTATGLVIALGYRYLTKDITKNA
jgi:hypothetical protein